MIHDLDQSLEALVRTEALNGSGADVVFDAPTKEWASRRNAPSIDLYLYDIREDLRRRTVGSAPMRAADGRMTGRKSPMRYFKMSYLLTAWTQRPEDEHRLLASLLLCFVRHDRMPTDALRGALVDLTDPVLLTIGRPPPEDRSFSDVWSALGGELKPSLDLVVTMPVDSGRIDIAAPPVTEQPRFSFSGPGAEAEQLRRASHGVAGTGDETGDEAAIAAAAAFAARRAAAASASAPGDLLAQARMLDEIERAEAATGDGDGDDSEDGSASGAGGKGRRGRAGGSGSGDESDEADLEADLESDDDNAMEVLRPGLEGGPGRVFRMRSFPRP